MHPAEPAATRRRTGPARAARRGRPGSIAGIAVLAVATLALQTPASASFQDVPAGSYFTAAVQWARAAGVTTGVGGTDRFEPHRPVTRAEAVSMLWRAQGQPGGSAPRFADQPAGAYFDQALRWARATAATTGVGGTDRFEPHRPVTRAEAITMLWRAEGQPRGSAPRFADQPAGAYFDQALRWARGHVTDGVGDTNRFAPQQLVTRAELVTFLHRAGAPEHRRPASARPGATTTTTTTTQAPRTTTTTQAPAAPPAPLSIRPYTADSPWNTPIGPDAQVHPDSALLLTEIHGGNPTGRPLTSDPTQYTYPVYEVTAATPERTVKLSGWFSDVSSPTHNQNGQAPTLQVRVPTGAQPSRGTDGSIIFRDLSTGEEWGFWQFAAAGDGTYTATNGYRYNTGWNGVPPVSPSRFVSRGAGMPYLAGLVRRAEIDAGRIDHALAFAYRYPAPSFVWPATKSDGKGPVDGIPEGARLQLDPSVDEADFDRWGLDEPARVIARALQTYGMYVVDNSGRPKIMIEDDTTADWQGRMTASTVSGIPWEHFRVLDWR